MRVVLEGSQRKKLSANFQELPGVRGGDALRTAFGMHSHPNLTEIISMRVAGVTAVWDSRTGECLWAPSKASAIAWTADGKSILVAFNEFGEVKGGRGVAHRLARYSWPGQALIDEIVFTVESGGLEHLIVSPSGGMALAVSSDQSRWHYQLLGIGSKLSQQGVRATIPHCYGDSPAFSPNERFIVSIGSPGPFWWAEESSGSRTSRGSRQLAVVYVHNLESAKVSRHSIKIKLDAAWKPADLDDGAWAIVWGPQFQSESSFRLWLPDGQAVDLELPLGRTVAVPKLLDPAMKLRKGGTRIDSTKGSTKASVHGSLNDVVKSPGTASANGSVKTGQSELVQGKTASRSSVLIARFLNSVKNAGERDLANYHSDLRLFFGWLDDSEYAQVELKKIRKSYLENMLNDYVQQLEKHHTPPFINRHLQSISRFFGYMGVSAVARADVFLTHHKRLQGHS